MRDGEKRRGWRDPTDERWRRWASFQHRERRKGQRGGKDDSQSSTCWAAVVSYLALQLHRQQVTSSLVLGRPLAAAHIGWPWGVKIDRWRDRLDFHQPSSRHSMGGLVVSASGIKVVSCML